MWFAIFPAHGRQSPLKLEFNQFQINFLKKIFSEKPVFDLRLKNKPWAYDILKLEKGVFSQGVSSSSIINTKGFSGLCKGTKKVVIM